MVILANSSPYLIPDIPGIDGGNVYTIPGLSKLAKLPLKLFSPEFIHKASRHFMPVGKKIVVLGAGAEGAQCATFMAHCGKDVTLLSEDDDIGGLVPVPYKVRLEPWFEENGVEVVRNATCKEIRKGLVIAEVDGRERTFGCDSVSSCFPRSAMPRFAMSSGTRVSRSWKSAPRWEAITRSSSTPSSMAERPHAGFSRSNHCSRASRLARGGRPFPSISYLLVRTNLFVRY